MEMLKGGWLQHSKGLGAQTLHQQYELWGNLTKHSNRAFAIFTSTVAHIKNASQ